MASDANGSCKVASWSSFSRFASNPRGVAVPFKTCDGRRGGRGRKTARRLHYSMATLAQRVAVVVVVVVVVV